MHDTQPCHPITAFYEWFRLLTQSQLADPSLYCLFIKTTTIYETIHSLMIKRQIPTKASNVPFLQLKYVLKNSIGSVGPLPLLDDKNIVNKKLDLDINLGILSYILYLHIYKVSKKIKMCKIYIAFYIFFVNVQYYIAEIYMV